MYIGISVKDDVLSKSSRPYKHLHGKGSKVVFQAVQKYGIENFLVVILHKLDCNKEELKELEKWYILHLNTRARNGYNLTSGGDVGVGTSKGWHHTKETINKISRTKLGHIVTKETINKISEANLGRKHTEEQNNKKSEAQIGENNNNSKVSNEQVKIIRELYGMDHYSQRMLGSLFGVSATQINRIIKYKARI